MPLTEENVDLVKKAGRAVAKIAGKNISLYYTVEKARNLTELLDALREVGHKLVGMKREDLQYISLDSIEKLVETLHTTGSDRATFSDIRNTLTIFAAVEYAKQNFRGGTSNE